MSLRLLLVEDDCGLRATLRQALQVEGFEVAAAASLADARAQWAESLREGRAAFDAVLLDLGLPDGDGAAFLTELRQRRGTPLLVISAREAEGQKIQALDAGADDYLVKPFGVGELLARLRVALRHRGHEARPAVTLWQGQSPGGVLRVDLAARRVQRDGADVRLTPREFALLAALVRQAGRVRTHRQLLAEVWGPKHVEQTQYLRLYMGQLRAKLEALPAEPRWLLTEPGVGYRLAAD